MPVRPVTPRQRGDISIGQCLRDIQIQQEGVVVAGRGNEGPYLNVGVAAVCPWTVGSLEESIVDARLNQREGHPVPIVERRRIRVGVNEMRLEVPRITPLTPLLEHRGRQHLDLGIGSAIRLPRAGVGRGGRVGVSRDVAMRGAGEADHLVREKIPG